MPLDTVLRQGDVVNIRARVRSVFLNESRYSVIAWIENPHNLGFQQVCVPLEVIELPRGMKPPPIDDDGPIDRLTARLLSGK